MAYLLDQSSSINWKAIFVKSKQKRASKSQARSEKNNMNHHCLRQPGNHRLYKALDPMALRPRLSPGLPFRTELILAQKKAEVNNLIIFSNLCNRACTPQSSIGSLGFAVVRPDMGVSQQTGDSLLNPDKSAGKDGSN